MHQPIDARVASFEAQSPAGSCSSPHSTAVEKEEHRAGSGFGVHLISLTLTTKSSVIIIFYKI
jgi:hypothetical protein